MIARASPHPELAEPRIGRRFTQRPSEKLVEQFLRHVWNTGTPHTWKPLTTTPHPKGDAPMILKPFSIPKRMRQGRDTRAPCSICSPFHPKFDHGFLVYSSDRHLRIIGHECGHEHFGEGYAAALKEHSDETAEAQARSLLAERMPDLARTLIEAITVGRSLRELLDFRERVIASITLTAVTQMRCARIGSHLTVLMPIDTEEEEGKGTKKIVTQPVAVAEVKGLEGLALPVRTLGDLLQAIRSAGDVLIIERHEIQPRLRAMSRHEAFAVALAVRRLDTTLQNAHKVRDNVRTLFAEEGLRGLSAWGRHNHCASPFWIEVVDGRVYLGRGLRPRVWDRGPSLFLPPEASYGDIEVS